MAIEGLNYVAGFIDQPAQQLLLAEIDREPWLSDLQRRVQHYGYQKRLYIPALLGQGCRGGEMPILPATIRQSAASGRWRVDEATNKFSRSRSVF
jgi:hypothetical protein